MATDNQLLLELLTQVQNETGDWRGALDTAIEMVEGEAYPDEYADRTWNGEPNSVIQSESNPWIENSAGVVDFGLLGCPVPGVFARSTEVQRFDIYEPELYRDDLEAAAALRDHLNATTGDTSHVVRFRGTL